MPFVYYYLVTLDRLQSIPLSKGDHKSAKIEWNAAPHREMNCKVWEGPQFSVRNKDSKVLKKNWHFHKHDGRRIDDGGGSGTLRYSQTYRTFLTSPNLDKLAWITLAVVSKLSSLRWAPPPFLTAISIGAASPIWPSYKLQPFGACAQREAHPSERHNV